MMEHRNTLLATLAPILVATCMPGCSDGPGGGSHDAGSLDSGAPDAEPPPWVFHPSNPVMVGDPGSTWMNFIADPWVMKDGAVYKMWFAAKVDAPNDSGVTEVGYATSDEGVTWNIHPTPVLRAGATGEWDHMTVETPTVIKRPDGVYEMWYSGLEIWGDYSGVDPAELYRHLFKIGHATSMDGIEWTKDPMNPVLDIDLVGQTGPDWVAVADPSVTFDGGMYRMWYTGVDSVAGVLQLQICLATSTDGSVWIRHATNPVLGLGPAGSWDSTLVAQPGVFRSGATYMMVYAGNDVPGAGDTVAPESGSLGLATSTDGIVWNRPSEPIIVKQMGTWTELGVWGATGLFDGDEIMVWYGGGRLTGRLETGFGLATQQRSVP